MYCAAANKYALPIVSAKRGTGYQEKWTSLQYIIYRLSLCYFEADGNRSSDNALRLRTLMRCSDANLAENTSVQDKMDITLTIWQCVRYRGPQKLQGDQPTSTFVSPSDNEKSSWPDLANAIQKRNLKKGILSRPFVDDGFGSSSVVPREGSSIPPPPDMRGLYYGGVPPYASRKAYGRGYRSDKKQVYKGMKTLKPYRHYGMPKPYGYKKAFRGGYLPKWKRVNKSHRMFKPYHGYSMTHPYRYREPFHGGYLPKWKRTYKDNKIIEPYSGYGMSKPYGYKKALRGVYLPKWKRVYQSRKTPKLYRSYGLSKPYRYPETFNGGYLPRSKHMYRSGEMIGHGFGGDLSTHGYKKAFRGQYAPKLKVYSPYRYKAYKRKAFMSDPYRGRSFEDPGMYSYLGSGVRDFVPQAYGYGY